MPMVAEENILQQLKLACVCPLCLTELHVNVLQIETHVVVCKG